jgi:uncharacterized protein YuzE
MKAVYDYTTDTLTVIFSEAPVAESDEDKEGVILDYGASGNLVSVEIFDASKRVSDPRSVTLELASSLSRRKICPSPD